MKLDPWQQFRLFSVSENNLFSSISKPANLSKVLYIYMYNSMWNCCQGLSLMQYHRFTIFSFSNTKLCLHKASQTTRARRTYFSGQRIPATCGKKSRLYTSWQQLYSRDYLLRCVDSIMCKFEFALNFCRKSILCVSRFFTIWWRLVRVDCWSFRTINNPTFNVLLWVYIAVNFPGELRNWNAQYSRSIRRLLKNPIFECDGI